MLTIIMPLSDLPLSDLPLSDLPLSDLPLSVLPLSDLPRRDPASDFVPRLSRAMEVIEAIARRSGASVSAPAD